MPVSVSVLGAFFVFLVWLGLAQLIKSMDVPHCKKAGMMFVNQSDGLIFSVTLHL